ncbi:MAG: hypothetical protein IAF38_01530 [Bacteroidia bacterium]|nr:hypothetical protein [Bacteroidia bacterium]
MAKQKNIPQKKTVAPAVQKKTVAAPIIETPNYRFFPFANHWIPYIILGLISAGIYFNSIWNENALDDGIIIQKNEFVLRGLKGIKGIMTKDSYYSFYRQMNAEDQLKGGRYRPLSVVSFAVEQEIIGTYKTGYFAKYTDTNRNNIIDEAEVNWWTDKNNDKLPEDAECAECWDKNHNLYRDTLKRLDPVTGKMVPVFQIDTFKTKPAGLKEKGLPLYVEDINQDGNVNDKDCEVEGHMMRHFNNVLFYMLAILILFSLLKDYLFKGNHDLAFLATLLFAIHPIHTEVIANVKSRDEIFSIMFICLTLIYIFRFIDNKPSNNILQASVALAVTFFCYHQKLSFLGLLPVMIIALIRVFKLIKNDNTSSLLMAGLMYWLAWLSKEYAFTLLLLAPMSIWLFRKNIPAGNYWKVMGILVFWTFIYIVARFSSVTINPGVPDTEVLNNPYLPIMTDNAELGWKRDIASLYATKFFVLLKYLSLQFFPHPLSSDYSFNTIPFKHFTDWEVWLSLFLNIGLAVLAVVLFFKRKPLAFALLFYFANLFMVGNILFDIGATMGERLVFHSSLGVAIFLAWLFTDGLGALIKNKVTQRVIVLAATVAILVPACYKTWTRNYDWKNDITLFCHDVETVPNSVLVLGNAGARSIDKSELPINAGPKQKEFLIKGKNYLRHALDLHPTYVNGYLNLGLAYYKLDMLDSSAITWKRAETLYPTNPYLNIYYGVLVPRLMAEAYEKGKAKDYNAAIGFMRKAVWLQPNNPETLYNMGGAFHAMGNADSAAFYFKKCLAVKPDHKLAAEGLGSITQAPSPQPIMIRP